MGLLCPIQAPSDLALASPSEPFGHMLWGCDCNERLGWAPDTVQNETRGAVPISFPV